MFKVIFYTFLVVAGVFALVYCLDSCLRKSHDVTESSPVYTLDLKDIHYKGHTYIYVIGPYSHTIVHAEHCMCHTVK